jgi:hypothetical protein
MNNSTSGIWLNAVTYNSYRFGLGNIYNIDYYINVVNINTQQIFTDNINGYGLLFMISDNNVLSKRNDGTILTYNFAENKWIITSQVTTTSQIVNTNLQPQVLGLNNIPKNLLNPNFTQNEWLGTFDTSGNGNSGNPIIRDNTLAFSYNQSSVSTTVQNLPGMSTYILSFDIQTYAFGPNSYGGYLQINIDFYDVNYNKVGTMIYGNISTPIPAYLTKTSISQETTGDMSTATYCIITITGKDNAYWLGFHGPSLSNISLMPLIQNNLVNTNIIG